MVLSNLHAREEAVAWGARGGNYALHVPRDNRSYSLETYLNQSVEAAAAHFEQYFTNASISGGVPFAYIAIDELGPGPPLGTTVAAWQDGGSLAARFVAFLERLAADGYDRRVILYVNSYARHHLPSRQAPNAGSSQWYSLPERSLWNFYYVVGNFP
jgi:hypothetical protein